MCGCSGCSLSKRGVTLGLESWSSSPQIYQISCPSLNLQVNLEYRSLQVNRADSSSHVQNPFQRLLGPTDPKASCLHRKAGAGVLRARGLS